MKNVPLDGNRASNFDDWIAEQMHDPEFRFWYRVWAPLNWMWVVRLRQWWYRVTHRREGRMIDEEMNVAKLTVELSDGRFFTGNIAIDDISKEESGVWAMRLQGAGPLGQEWEGDAVTFRFVPGTPTLDVLDN